MYVPKYFAETRVEVLHELMRTHPVATRVTDAPEDFIAQQRNAIVGLEIPIARLVGKYQASQNRTACDRHAVVEGLREEQREASLEMAEWVRRRE